MRISLSSNKAWLIQMTAVPNITSLHSLRSGQVAEVREIDGPAEDVRRLAELGLRNGARLELVRSGSPCILRINGATFCFRNTGSVNVVVAPRMSA